MITTRESINYQFSIMFGYSSPDDLIVGDVVGPGKLTKEKVNELSLKVMKFLRMYNAILRDYSGSEVFSIEFELYNIDEKDSSLKIYPKSMILVPGRYKDCISLLLALKPETGYLDTHKSRDSVDHISKLFYEVEEFTNRPELKKVGKEKVLKKFASRFSQKLFGELIEDKWNKKLIGLSTSLPTEKKMLNIYATIKSDVEIIWHKRPHEIEFFNPEFEKIKTPFEGQQAIEHLKYLISEPSANFIVENTLKLGANLMNIANTGTIDEFQDSLVLYIIHHIENKIEESNRPETANWLISQVEDILFKLNIYMNKFLELSNAFLITGNMGDLPELLEKFSHFIKSEGRSINYNFEEICRIAIDMIDQSIVQKKNLRAAELRSLINYFSEIIKSSMNLIKKSLPKYLSRRRLKILTKHFIKNLFEKLEKEIKPSKILGQKYLEKFHDFLLDQIEINHTVLSREQNYNDEKAIEEFKNIIVQNLDSFFKKITLTIGDLVSFAEIEMEKESKVIKTHIDNFKKFSSEIHYLLGYILRYSTINRYLKDEPENEISDPVSFANKFHRFLEKRIGGINFAWKSYIFDWINDYSKNFFKLDIPNYWTIKEIYVDFLGYLGERESNEQNPERFLEFIDNYNKRLPDGEEREHLLDFYNQYKFCIEIKDEIPNFIRQIIENELTSLKFLLEELIPINFLNIEGEDDLYNYIKESALMYFSKLIPRPHSLILKHSISNEERELFNGSLFHVINFDFKDDKLIFDLADNFKQVYREWLKEL